MGKIRGAQLPETRRGLYANTWPENPEGLKFNAPSFAKAYLYSLLIRILGFAFGTIISTVPNGTSAAWDYVRFKA